MKRIIFIIASFLCITRLFGQIACLNELEIKDSLIYYQNIIYTGEYNCIDNTGILNSRGFIKEGMLDSITEYYDKNGNLTEMVWYKENQVVQRRLFKNVTSSKLVIKLKNGIEHGLWERYFPSGEINERKYYDKGKPTGVWITWDKKGRKIIENDFTGDPVVTKYYGYKNNKQTIIIHYIDKKTRKKIKKEKIVE